MSHPRFSALTQASTIDPLVIVDDGQIAAFNGDANSVPDFIDTSDWDTSSARMLDPMKTISAAHRLVRTAATGPQIKQALLRTELFVEDYFK